MSLPAAAAEASHVDSPRLQAFVFALFFIFGGITSLNDVIIPKLKELFTLSYTQAMLVQFCFFTAYAVIGIPGAWLVKKVGYMRGAVTGLLLMMAGCLLFIPASENATYALFLAALFVLASGVVIVQVVANPLISMLGKPETSHSRLTFAQGFNSLGTTVFPYFGAILILGSLASQSAGQLSGAALDAYRTAETQAIMNGYLGLAVAIAVVAGVVWLFRNALPAEQHTAGGGLAGIDLLTPAALRLRGAVHIPLRRCRGLDWIADRQLSGPGAGDGAGRAECRQTDWALLGRRDGGPLRRFGGAAAWSLQGGCWLWCAPGRSR